MRRTSSRSARSSRLPSVRVLSVLGWTVRKTGPRARSMTATITFEWLGVSNTIPSSSGPSSATFTSSPAPIDSITASVLVPALLRAPVRRVRSGRARVGRGADPEGAAGSRRRIAEPRIAGIITPRTDAVTDLESAGRSCIPVRPSADRREQATLDAGTDRVRPFSTTDDASSSCGGAPSLPALLPPREASRKGSSSVGSSAGSRAGWWCDPGRALNEQFHAAKRSSGLVRPRQPGDARLMGLVGLSSRKEVVSNGDVHAVPDGQGWANRAKTLVRLERRADEGRGRRSAQRDGHQARRRALGGRVRTVGSGR